MSKIIDVPLSSSGLEKISRNINKIIELLESDELKDFFKKKLLDSLYMISIKRINSIDNQDDATLSTYLAGIKAEVKGDIIYIYNDSVIDINESKFLDKDKMKNYPLQLSLAKIVEYGIGFTGAETPQEYVDKNWEYDVNNHGIQGWYYKDQSGQFHWTNGYHGKLIFHRLEIYVKENANKWFKEYLEKKLSE